MLSGLDPAGPLWVSNSNSMSSTDGQYVEAIHTDGGLLGIFNRVADADFYPNGGRHPQPGCGVSTCSHSRAHQMFASSVRTNHFVARQCTSLDEAENNLCTGETMHMGNGHLDKTA
jgi:hypothetical protein